ncbi:MAG: NUDIX hydrolase [Acidobacteria bacterium]|nr:NUDIX hydrolase [Acidobacteriota bacterium]
MKPEVTASETAYEGRVFDVRVDTIREGASEYKREIVVHKGSAVIMPVFADGTVALVRQYRHAAREYLLELPAGTLNEGEDPEVGARRELEEEIGVVAEKIEKLCEFYVSPGFLTERMHLFLATGLTETAQNLDEDEFVEIERYSPEKLTEMVQNGTITDAKTIIGIALLAASGLPTVDLKA